MTRCKYVGYSGCAAVFGLAVFLICPPASWGQATEETQVGTPAAVDEPAEERAAVSHKRKNALLAVVVLGDGKPVRDAEVKVKFPPSVGGDETRPTDDGGEASFESTGTGIAKVRVLCTGWESILQEVTLKEGSQKLTIKLRRSEL